MSTRRISLGLALTILFFVGLVTYLTLWHFPLINLDSLTTVDQDANFTDQNYYLHVASTVCLMPTWSVDDITVTWSAVGVIGYLTYGCRLLGTEYFYILLNPLLVAMSLGLVVRIGQIIGLKATIRLPSVLLLPYTFLTLSLPGKEIISVVGTLVMLGGLMLVSARRRIPVGLSLIAAGLLVISVSRMHESGALAVFCVLWLTGTLRAPVRLLIFLVLATHFAGDLLQGVSLNQDASSLTDEILWSGSSDGKSVDFDEFFSFLRADNLLTHALLGLFRVLVVLCSPLSSLITPPLDTNWSYFIFRDVSQRLRLVDFAFIFYVFARILRVNWTLVREHPAKDWAMMPLLFLYMIYVISFFGVSQKSRYIFQYTPVLLLWLWLYSDRLASASRRRFLWRRSRALTHG